MCTRLFSFVPLFSLPHPCDDFPLTSLPPFSLPPTNHQVTNGKNAMPAFGGRLDEDEIKNVAAYVFDQSTNAKWD